MFSHKFLPGNNQGRHCTSIRTTVLIRIYAQSLPCLGYVVAELISRVLFQT